METRSYVKSVAHPAAKNMIELSRTQDEECGDGTTGVIILAGEILAQLLSQLERDIHPVVIISAYNKALKEALEIVNRTSIPINVNDDKQMLNLIIGTKFSVRWSDLMTRLPPEAVRTVSSEDNGHTIVDIKHYARVEKVPGGGDRGQQGPQGRHDQQGHHPPQHASSHQEPAH
ncbi:hypothetical protein FA15DRAFT_733558 [Coprinopsis marcescibilis]|uniref:Uncharacterized protein n=1 Tax=Coprinopsis marcescibilis TaxID=230819 RepID=A0A5C3KCR9_COPMA|nr:hypothetical protein FA15DRAFT_733558 [Coprinopsis marcescibilis]